MIGDNPAARLLAILEAGALQNSKNNCRNVWRELLGVQTGRDALLMSRIGKVMELPEQAIEIINRDFPNQKSTFNHWNTKVNQAFSQQNLNSEWGSFQAQIDQHTLTYLRLTAELIQTKLPTKLLEQETIEELRSRINQLLNEVIDGDFKNEIVEYVARYLQRIITALDEYRISGAVPIIEAVDASLGHAFFDESYREVITKTEFGQKFITVLSAVASAVTIAIGAPELPHVIHLLLEKFR
ncbi:hypothetical protein [Methylomonas rivi]|uniref:Uncharacterized protein n=1 Tax=Methylomonas rivi TaxID=2952226 RepID=A0ABT1U392_9GAMM|nr:hypothetical protein [Methylomonas sp. WSC-6]MCQ8128312.1 hypothetical protein [Methylomonas sp. WSC-6]